MIKRDIRFKDYLIPLIKSGEKVFTYRKGDKYAPLEIGDIVYFINGSNDVKEGKIKIIGKYYTSFKDLPFDAEGHEKYNSKQHQKEVFEEYYGEMDDNEKILVLKFELTD